MAGSILLRSYLDLVNGPLENTVNYSSDSTGRKPIEQVYSSLRKFTKRVGTLGTTGATLSKVSDVGDKGLVFRLLADTRVRNIFNNMQNKMAALANGHKVVETSENSLVYHTDKEWSKYVLDFGNDLPNPRYLAFFNLDSKPIYICKSCKFDAEGGYYDLVPFLTVNPNQSIGPIIFNPRFGLLFVVSENEDEEQDLYVIAYNA